MHPPKHFLPTTTREIEYLGWQSLDIILITGDAYVDHPSFGVAVIGRILEREGYKVAILPQPNWRDDLRDFKKLGKPKLFFGITSGNMDSMVNHYTATKRIRSDDAFTPGGVAGFRPDYAVTVYTNIVKQLYPDVPVVIGGIEASLRRLSHYDYWSDSLKPSILQESKANFLLYGMGEKAIVELAKCFSCENPLDEIKKRCLQIAFMEKDYKSYSSDAVLLHPFEKEKQNKKYYGENFTVFEKETSKLIQKTIVQPYNDQFLIMRPPYPVATEKEMDSYALFDVMMNAPHPKYLKRGAIPAWEMICNSITIHRGCFGGCAFCAIAAHQGKFIASRSEKSIIQEINDLSQCSYFKGHITDLGAPSANMYKMLGKNEKRCQNCEKPSCIFPSICKNLDINHYPLIHLYQKAENQPDVKKVTIGSGIRYDMLLHPDPLVDKKNGLSEYLETVVRNHVSGRLKVAPEHTSDKVLTIMRKPPFGLFMEFLKRFHRANKKSGKNQQLIPYFISSHPGCTIEDMANLVQIVKQERLSSEQVQDFTPTPMTYATAIYFLGYDPYTQKKIPIARSMEEKRNQYRFFFYYKKKTN